MDLDTWSSIFDRIIHSNQMRISKMDHRILISRSIDAVNQILLTRYSGLHFPQRKSLRTRRNCYQFSDTPFYILNQLFNAILKFDVEFRIIWDGLQSPIGDSGRIIRSSQMRRSNDDRTLVFRSLETLNQIHSSRDSRSPIPSSGYVSNIRHHAVFGGIDRKISHRLLHSNIHHRDSIRTAADT